MLAEIMASFSDCSSSTEGLEGNKGKRYSNSERTGSRKRILSGGYRRDSHVSGGEDFRGNFSNAPAGASGVRQYKGMVPQPNECRDTQICEKRQQVTFINGEDETAKAISAFKLDVRDANAITVVKPHQEVAHLETRVLSVHSKGEIVEMLFRKNTSDEETGHSKNIDRPRSCSETEEEEEQDLEGSERIYNPGGGEDNEKASFWRREHMFEKVVTPSDVGKLNRLVIPKQHAEKYFPLDIVAHEKGLLLNFEDSTGKAWRFGYSYWNSSQSYVLTKGWSRFVKETKLGAGDIVSFDRATLQNPNLQRLFITWRRKPFSAIQPPGLPDAVIGVPLRLSVPFQFPYGAINYIGGSHGQQLTSSRVLIPQCMPFYWPANNISRDSDRSPAETRALQANAQPMDSLTSLHFNTTNDKPRKNILDPAFPFSIQRSLNCGRPAVDMESSVRTPPLDAIQLKSRRISRDDLSRPIENKVPEAAATSFHNSTSKKVVRLFGVDLECGKVDSNYEDELLIIPPSELLLARNSTFPHPRDQRRH